ncbi:unnamed protein product [Vitrella brassicaformis CCMP3155]|uniref:Uncharacterized protein n=1 Tax=Vitrella brassicaformis (strain CCMP3155) TaxID=1169540 RepID=A0A0G4EMR3_VITBC|nr:unnamed protein product [Vitrella brassicaformis CCMP3155]|eukprot:CEL98461.1 unnamed protein product [Vitrella brassicaformis CCMP3155]
MDLLADYGSDEEKEAATTAKDIKLTDVKPSPPAAVRPKAKKVIDYSALTSFKNLPAPFASPSESATSGKHDHHDQEDAGEAPLKQKALEAAANRRKRKAVGLLSALPKPKRVSHEEEVLRVKLTAADKAGKNGREEQAAAGGAEGVEGERRRGGQVDEDEEEEDGHEDVIFGNGGGLPAADADADRGDDGGEEEKKSVSKDKGTVLDSGFFTLVDPDYGDDDEQDDEPQQPQPQPTLPPGPSLPSHPLIPTAVASSSSASAAAAAGGPLEGPSLPVAAGHMGMPPLAPPMAWGDPAAMMGMGMAMGVAASDPWADQPDEKKAPRYGELPVDMRKFENVQTINADDLRDKDWRLKNSVAEGAKGVLGMGREKAPWNAKYYDPNSGSTLMSHDPTKHQKRKHQIGYLAHEAQERELELFEATAHTRQSKYQTQMKYGW